MSVRTDDQRGELNNKVSAMFTSLATDVDDPIERLQVIHEVTKGAKEDHNVLGANLLQDWAEHAAPTTFALAARLYSSMNLSDRHRPIHNVVISNVPGPPFPLYYAGAKAVYTLPMGPVMEGAGLNITVLSYMDNVDVGFMVCRELVPDVWKLADYVQEAMAELLKAIDDVPRLASRASSMATTMAARRSARSRGHQVAARGGGSGSCRRIARCASMKRRRRPRAGGRPVAIERQPDGGQPYREIGSRVAPRDGDPGTIRPSEVRLVGEQRPLVGQRPSWIGLVAVRPPAGRA